MYDRIVVGTDLSETSLVACRRAAELSRALQADLELVHVGRDPGPRLRAVAEEHGGRVSVRAGDPADELVAAACGDGATLLVVGSVGMRGARRFLLGSVPDRVSHHVATDLLIVRTDRPGAEPRSYRRILVGADGSDTSMRAVEAAACFATALGLEMVVVSAYEPPPRRELEQMKADPDDPIAQWSNRTVRETPPEFRWRIADAAQARDVLERAAEHAARRGAEAEVRAVRGVAAEVLLDLAASEGFDVIAVGSVGMRGSKRLMLGNVPNRVSHHAPTDVLILRTA